MNARRIVPVIIVATTAWASPAFLQAWSISNADTSFAATEVSREYHYRVDARARPFLFWIRKSNIGEGRLRRLAGPGGAIGYELLVGSDPGRAPRGINRWGYLREESRASGSMVFGVMSQSDEQSIEEANKATSGGQRVHVFKALRQVTMGSEAQVTVSDVRVSKDLTYSDLDTLLASVPAAPSKTKVVPMTEWTATGFLAAAASLMDAGRPAASKGAKSAALVRVYPYNGTLYELELRSTDRIDARTPEGRPLGPAVRGVFHVLNRTTGEKTPFTIVYGLDDALAGVPLLISWRPRWWLEIECVLRDDPRG